MEGPVGIPPFTTKEKEGATGIRRSGDKALTTVSLGINLIKRKNEISWKEMQNKPLII